MMDINKFLVLLISFVVLSGCTTGGQLRNPAQVKEDLPVPLAQQLSLGSEAEEIYKSLLKIGVTPAPFENPPSNALIKTWGQTLLHNHKADISDGKTFTQSIFSQTISNAEFFCSYQWILYAGNGSNGLLAGTAFGQESWQLNMSFDGSERIVLAKNYLCYRKRY